jgi:hypothetical protein
MYIFLVKSEADVLEYSSRLGQEYQKENSSLNQSYSNTCSIYPIEEMILIVEKKKT